MQAYFVAGTYHGYSAHLKPRHHTAGPVRSGQVPPRVLITDGEATHEYELAHYTGGHENLADADLYYTPSNLTDEQRSEAIAELIRAIAPWQTTELQSSFMTA